MANLFTKIDNLVKPTLSFVFMDNPKIAYISFDVIPAPKGAGVHIAAFVQALATHFGKIQLVTVSPTASAIAEQEIWPNVFQVQLPALGDTVIERSLYFRAMLGNWWQDRKFEVVHFRSIYEGFPLALHKQKVGDRLIFEVNGLPSIELKYRYPAIADDRELLHKLQAQEQICLNAADLIVTPSRVTGKYLQTKGVAENKIRIIPNGVNLEIFTCKDLSINLTTTTPFKLLYFGTLAAWQGVNLALEALGLLCRDLPVELTVIGPIRARQDENLQALAAKLEVANQLTLLPPLPQAELISYIHAADAIVAPLTANDRNLVQGCCPLKILESMATGTPVITSDLPAVRELGEDERELLLVKPGSAKAIKDAVLKLHANPELKRQIAINARQRIASGYNWQQAGKMLASAYGELGISIN